MPNAIRFVERALCAHTLSSSASSSSSLPSFTFGIAASFSTLDRAAGRDFDVSVSPLLSSRARASDSRDRARARADNWTTPCACEARPDSRDAVSRPQSARSAFPTSGRPILIKGRRVTTTLERNNLPKTGQSLMLAQNERCHSDAAAGVSSTRLWIDGSVILGVGRGWSICSTIMPCCQKVLNSSMWDVGVYALPGIGWTAQLSPTLALTDSKGVHRVVSSTNHLSRSTLSVQLL